MDNEFYERLGARLRELRRARHMTQEMMAARLGLNRTTVVNIEQGRQRLAVHQLVDIATILGHDPSVLLDLGAQREGATPEEEFVARIRAKAQRPRSTQ